MTRADAVTFTDPGFLDPGRRLLPPFRSVEDALRWATHLGRCVTRAPLDLTRHTRRILALQRCRDGAGLYGALLDLFIALGPRGRDLRRGLLAQSWRLLAADTASFLAAYLESGLAATTPHPPAPASRLTAAITGTLDYLRPITAAPAVQAHDALAEAEALLAQGEVAAPMALLEAALARDPGAADALELLLEIYRRGSFTDEFAALCARQPELAGTAPRAWHATAAALHVKPDGSGPGPDVR